MIWVDREVKKIQERRFSREWVDDMKTPSGRIHVGALRGVVIHDMMAKVLAENGVKTTFTYVFEDHDPMDAIPAYLDFKKWEKYAGRQLYQIPSPESGYPSFAHYYAAEFQKVFESINCRPRLIWGSELYRSGKMNGVVKTVLDAAPKIREIYARVAKAQKPADWHPFNVVCQKCGKIGTTYVYKWDGKDVFYRCLPQMVAWAQGCGYEGKMSPLNSSGKMPWKIEWAAKWKVIGVTVEGAGKDHMSSGGSHDIASAICREVLDYPVPYPIPYEWFIVAGKKMSSSKGVGASAKEVAALLPPDLLRFLIVRTPIGTALDFNHYGQDTIANLFDDFDRCLEAYFLKLENKLGEGKQAEVRADFARIIELSSVADLPKKRLLLPRFRTIVNLLKNKTDPRAFFEQKKGRQLTVRERKILEERINYAESYLSKEPVADLKVKKLSSTQKDFLRKLGQKLAQSPQSKQEVQTMIFEILKEDRFSARQVFPAFYQVLLNTDHGPKAADVIMEYGVEKVFKKLKNI